MKSSFIKSILALSFTMLLAGSAAAGSAPDVTPAGKTESGAEDRQIKVPGDDGVDMKVKICCGTAGDLGVICWRC